MKMKTDDTFNHAHADRLLLPQRLIAWGGGEHAGRRTVGHAEGYGKQHAPLHCRRA
ncbi:hypothetical protein NXX14_16810 [Bacteroides xylanisolvens]|nr:hypothetical protein [Bacteroides xylanisolvens]